MISAILKKIKEFNKNLSDISETTPSDITQSFAKLKILVDKLNIQMSEIAQTKKEIMNNNLFFEDVTQKLIESDRKREWLISQGVSDKELSEALSDIKKINPEEVSQRAAKQKELFDKLDNQMIEASQTKTEIFKNNSVFEQAMQKFKSSFDHTQNKVKEGYVDPILLQQNFDKLNYLMKEKINQDADYLGQITKHRQLLKDSNHSLQNKHKF